MKGEGRRLRPTGQTPFQSAGDRHAVCVQDQAGEALSFFVAAPSIHPLETGPIAIVDRPEVEELWATLGTWLGKV